MALALLWTISITIACLVSMTNVPAVNINEADKIAHLSFYAIFSVLWFLYFQSRIKNKTKLFVTVFVLSVSFGILIEFCQSQFTNNRQADIQDAIANTIGATIGLTIMALYTKRFKN